METETEEQKVEQLEAHFEASKKDILALMRLIGKYGIEGGETIVTTDQAGAVIKDFINKRRASLNKKNQLYVSNSYI